MAEWNPPYPEDILDAVERLNTTGPRAVFLVVDGLNMISNIYGETALIQVLLHLGGLERGGNNFRIICATSRTSEPIVKNLKRKKGVLPCSLVKPLTIQGVEVFRTGNLLENILTRDCGGHGRALECILNVLRTYHRQDPHSEVTSKKVLEYMTKMYSNIIPSEGGEAVFKAVMAKRFLHKYKPIPGTITTPNELCAKDLVTFDNLSGFPRAAYLRVPYIWVMIFARGCRDTRYAGEIELMD